MACGDHPIACAAEAAAGIEGRAAEDAPPQAQSKEANSSAIFHVLFFFVGFSLVLLVPLYIYRFRDYVLTLDEPALLVHTLKTAPRGWFTQGFSDYFVDYPEWAQPSSNFLRPVDQFFVYCLHTIFGENYGLYFTLYFLAQFAILMVVVHTLKLAGLPRRAQFAAGVVCATSSAFVTTGLVSFAFAYDLVAAAFCATAFLALVHQRVLVAFGFLTLAVFTKETAIFAPLAASAMIALTYSRTRRTACQSVLLGLPIVLWAGSRWFAFGSIFGGAAPLGNGTPKFGIESIVNGVLFWPTGQSDPSGFGAILRGDLTNPEIPASLASASLNLIVWLALAMYFFKLARDYFRSNREDFSPADRTVYGSAVWLTGSLGIVVATVSGEPRYGAAVFVFLIITLFIAYHRFTETSFRLATITSLLLLAGIFAYNVGWQFPRSLISEFARLQKLNLSLADAIRQLPQNGEEVLIINAPPIYGAPKYFAEANHLKRNIVFVNQVTMTSDCQVADDYSAKAIRSPAGVDLRVELPTCADFGFVNTPDVFAGMEKHNFSVGRGTFGIYEFPKARLSKKLFRGANQYDFGKVLEVHLDHAPNDVIAYDWATGVYHLVVPDAK